MGGLWEPGSPRAGTRRPLGAERTMGSAESEHEIPIPDRFLEEAARPEAEARLAARLPAKLRAIADSRLVALAREAYGYATHPAVSRRTKLLGAGRLLYLIAPLDPAEGRAPGL